MEYRIFIASSMQNSCRELMTKIIERVNTKLEIINVKFILVEYSETPIVDHESNTQQVLYHEAATSDMLILLIDNNIPIGKYTFGEYQAAFSQSSKSHDGRPFIKAFALYDQNEEKKHVTYIAEDGKICDFEKKIGSDSKRYVQFLLRSKFCEFFEDWLVMEALYGLENNLKQNELSYSDHLHKIGQGGIREYKNKYYRRDKLDGQIEKIFKTSPIIILEGNTYSGKTRAAFEFMRNNIEWEEYDFHIYDNRYFIKELNGIHSIDCSGKNRGDIFLFDDINDILKRNDTLIDYKRPLWAKINGYNNAEGFNLDDFGKNRIIFTVSGKLSTSEKNKLYQKIFNTWGDKFLTNLRKIIINFDIYDQSSFRQMVSAMVREGVIARACIRPGNYTIGSLFIRTEDIRNQANEQYEINSALILALVAHFKYATDSRFVGLIDEIQELYEFICNIGKYKQCTEQLEEGIERLRREGLIVTKDEQDTLYQIFVDKYILDVFNEVIIKNIKYKNTKGTYALNSILIDYALKCQETRGGEDLKNHHICFVTQMAYLLVDRNKLEDYEIIDLIEIVSSTLLFDKKYNLTKNTNALVIVKLVNIMVSNPERYSGIFASSVIASIGDFEKVNALLDTCYKYYEHCKAKFLKDKSEKAIELYKRTVYEMLQTGNRIWTMEQEQRILDRVLDSNEDWKSPFGSDDLKNVFNLARLTAYIKKMSAQQIIELLPAANTDGYDIYSDDNFGDLTVNKNDILIEMDDDFDEIESPLTLTVENELSGIYEKVFLKQLSRAVITAIRRINSFNDFIKTVESLRTVCNKSIHVKRAISSYFARNFYNIVTEITKNLNYADRTEFFNFIFSIDDTKGVLGNVTVEGKYVEQLRKARIHSLNELLEYLDENTALESYQKMIDNSLCDMYTLSCLLKNEFLNFEQILRLIGKDDGQSNFITLNQLMGKAETLSDANVCMRLMGIVDCNPYRIRDENALANYLQIKYIDCYRCIEVIKGRRQLYQDVLSDAMISVVLKKFNIEQLIDLFFPSEENMSQGYYLERYGFLDEEIESMRKNAMHLSILFFKANTDKSGNDIAERIKGKFEEIIQSEDLRLLVTDPECNGNNGIISVYMKNKYLFCDYKGVRQFYDNLPEKCRPPKVDHNIYGVFLWYIIDAYKNNEYNRTTAIQLLNDELIEAYKEFAKLYTKDKVINMMAKLYHYRPLLTDEGCFDEIEEYVYESQRLNRNYKDYLDYLINNNTTYVDDTFIFNALTMMRKQINNEIYEELAVLASLNHTGVKYDTIFKLDRDKKTPIFSKEMQQRLFRLDMSSNTLNIDRRLVYNVSYIKVLWFLLNKEKMTFEEAEEYRERNNIPITETYLNLVIKHIELNTLRNSRISRYNNKILEDGYNQIINYIKKIFSTKVSYIHKSIQMCLSLIAVSPNEEALNQIFLDDGFCEFENKVEVITARMNRLLNLRYKSNKAYLTLSEFKEMILANCRSVNIWIVNIYLSTFVKIDKYELLDEDYNIDDSPFQRCWPLLEMECKIDLFQLLNLDEEQKLYIMESIGLQEKKWILKANVQTFSYFTQCSPNLISTMDTLFNGNFTYDDLGKKSCLKDTLKNYAFAYDNYKQDMGGLQKEVNHIGEILLRKSNRKVFKEVCDEYIIKSAYKRNSTKWNRISLLWKDLLFHSRFRVALVRYICELDLPDYICKFNKFISVDINDFHRVKILQNALCLEKFDDTLRNEINCYYDKVRCVAKKTENKCIYKNAELIKLIFLLEGVES